MQGAEVTGYTPASMVSLTKRLVLGGLWVLAGKVILVLSTLLINALLARLLAPQEMGAYFLTFSLVSVAAVAAQFGLSQAVVKLVAESLASERPGRAANTIRFILRSGALGALLVAGMLALGVGSWLAQRIFDSALMAGVIGLAALWVVVLTLQNLLAESFRGFHEIRLATLSGGVITSVLSALLFAGLWIVQGHSNLEQVVVLSVIAGATNAVIAFLLLRGKLKPFSTKNDFKGKEVFRIAWPLWVTNLTLIVLLQADLWIMGMFRPQEEVAIYGAALRFVVLVTMPLMIVNSVVSPFIAEMYTKRRRKDLQETLRAAATTASIPAFAVVIVFTLFGSPILALVYGEFYRNGATVLALLSLGQFVNVLAGSCGLVLMMTGFQASMMWITIVCGLLTVTGAMLLVEQYGANGVATVAAAAMMTQNGLMLLFCKLKTGIWTHAKLPHNLPLATTKL